MIERDTYVVASVDINDKITTKVFNSIWLNYTNANKYAKELYSRSDIMAVDIAVMENDKPRVFSRYTK